jgi:hypothetical protein
MTRFVSFGGIPLNRALAAESTSKGGRCNADCVIPNAYNIETQ